MQPEELTDKAIDYMVDHLIGLTHCSNGKPLSSWELSFIESVSDQWTRSKRLSEKQKEVLGNIWDKV